MINRGESAEYLHNLLPVRTIINWQSYLIENARNRHAYKIKFIKRHGKAFYTERELLAFVRYFKLSDVKNSSDAGIALSEALEAKSKEEDNNMRIGFGLHLNNLFVKRIEKNDSFKDFEDGKRIRVFLETERDIVPHTYSLSLEQAKQFHEQLTAALNSEKVH